jgi:polyhydroxyalkanoate synthesis repressor PhaR
MNSNEQTTPSTNRPHVVRRYANRKFYDTEASRYVTLAGMAELIRSGREVQVVDLATGREITAATYAQIICEEERRNPSLSPAELSRIIREGLRPAPQQQTVPQQ